MTRYNPADIEPKWQKKWADDGRYTAPDTSDKPKYYVTGMFPYPSGAGMHTGHFFEHSIVDAVARFRRSLGYNVMYPMGWDSFGLPAENYAIKTGRAPAVTTLENIANFKNQLRRVGSSIDWSREVNTTDPSYYKWTQWVFTQLFERGLAYQKEANQWWCPVDKTVLANEQVEGGKCWRCGNDVVKKAMKQWFFKITDYADALLEEIPDLDWPDKIKTAQTNWIGRSKGAEVTFAVDGSDEHLTVFTTRPDTLFGATFLVLAPEHPLVKDLVTDETRDTVDVYVQEAVKKSEIERQSEGKEKTGVFTGAYAVNPANGAKIPVWVADYVLWGYGTGAIMAVPAHDERDFAFATKYKLPIIEVVEKPADFVEECYHGDGVLMNSGDFTGVPSAEARELIVQHLHREASGEEKVVYKMRDWLISRQRYWGAPIPIIHCPEHGAVAVPEKDLPVLLPEVEDYAPRGDGKSVLAAQEEWVKTTCPTCNAPALRETDTMDGYACSSWYLLRYTDAHNNEQAWAPEKAAYWSPVDMYVGGDHAVAHLLYVRFWSHVFYDMKLVPTKEPVKKLVYHGLIQAEDGRKMSKSLGNTIDPLEVIDAGYGADALRTFELFLGPINEDSNWSSRGIAGVYRFLNRFWTLTEEYLASEKDNANSKDLATVTHATIKKVTDDIDHLDFNTAIAALMECVNELYKLKLDGFSEQWQFTIESLVKLIQPFAPHMTAELWERLGHETQLDTEPWPVYDESLLVRDTMTIVLQVNGKVRANIDVPADVSREDLERLALENVRVKEFMGDKKPARVIVVPGRLVNVVVV
jgi:leucyl-tRNA synthetase